MQNGFFSLFFHGFLISNLFNRFSNWSVQFKDSTFSDEVIGEQIGNPDQFIFDQDQIIGDQDQIVGDQDQITGDQDYIIYDEDLLINYQNQFIYDQDQYTDEKDDDSEYLDDDTYDHDDTHSAEDNKDADDETNNYEYNDDDISDYDVAHFTKDQDIIKDITDNKEAFFLYGETNYFDEVTEIKDVTNSPNSYDHDFNDQNIINTDIPDSNTELNSDLLNSDNKMTFSDTMPMADLFDTSDLSEWTWKP